MKKSFCFEGQKLWFFNKHPCHFYSKIHPCWLSLYEGLPWSLIMSVRQSQVNKIHLKCDQKWKITLQSTFRYYFKPLYNIYISYCNHQPCSYSYWCKNVLVCPDEKWSFEKLRLLLFSKLDWSSYILCIAKIAPKKLEPWFVPRNFLLLTL